MTTYAFEESELQALKGKTVLITGCATGIGRETAKIAHRKGSREAQCYLGVDTYQTMVQTSPFWTGMNLPLAL